MENSRNNQICRFGEHMPALLRAIDEADRRGQFRRKPVGPLGSCIRLRDPELGLAVESCLKFLMLAFCCDNYADERELQKIMSRCLPSGRRPQIIITTFTDTLYNVGSRAVNHPEYPSVLQALDIENPVVANCLIDMRGIETILLIKNSKDARRVMMSGHPPRNCREAFTQEGDQVFYKSYYSCEQNRALYLSKDVEEEIRTFQRGQGTPATQRPPRARLARIRMGLIQNANDTIYTPRPGTTQKLLVVPHSMSEREFVGRIRKEFPEVRQCEFTLCRLNRHRQIIPLILPTVCPATIMSCQELRISPSAVYIRPRVLEPAGDEDVVRDDNEMRTNTDMSSTGLSPAISPPRPAVRTDFPAKTKKKAIKRTLDKR